ncbi:MAG: Ribonuclease BN [Promethearchaeota archaeon]|nr:MAG: Ribonuclease BN [Candidatus Lokiarchaeota archaeon]
MEIYFLGTNGWYASSTGNTVSILIQSNDFYLILDAGDGIHKLDDYMKEDKPVLIFLSHTHLDHIIGLHQLGKFSFLKELIIFGFKGITRNLNRIIRHPYSAPFDNLPINVKIVELEEGTHNLPFEVKCGLLKHSDPCLGYRFTLENKIITYCTDTGLCENLYKLSEDANVLITECSYKIGQENWNWPHLKPEEAASVALESRVEQLLLTHFDASIYQTMEDRKNAENKAREIFPHTTAAYDNLKVEL